jgi:putative transcriptional regulator
VYGGHRFSRLTFLDEPPEQAAILCNCLYALDCIDYSKFVQQSQAAFTIYFLGARLMIKVKVPQLMKEKGYNATDLMRKANIAYGTAYRLSKGEAEAMSFEVLESLCRLFDARVEDVLEYVPEE